LGEGVMVTGARSVQLYSLQRSDEAFADAKRSYELHPNELALSVLGDIVHDRKDDKAAKLLWMRAYHMGDQEDGLIASLKSIGVDHPEDDLAKCRPKPKPPPSWS